MLLLRSFAFATVCVPVWLICFEAPSTLPDDERGLLPASAVVWTGLCGLACFAAPAGRAYRRARPADRRQVRVRRRHDHGGPVPTLRVTDATAAGQSSAAAVTTAVVDPAVWRCVQRIVSQPTPTPAGPAYRVDRRARRRGVVRFFDGRTTLCAVGGVMLENPTLRTRDDLAAC